MLFPKKNSKNNDFFVVNFATKELDFNNKLFFPLSTSAPHIKIRGEEILGSLVFKGAFYSLRFNLRFKGAQC